MIHDTLTLVSPRLERNVRDFVADGNPSSGAEKKLRRKGKATERNVWRPKICLVLGCPRKLGSMVSKWVLSHTYKWGILGV